MDTKEFIITHLTDNVQTLALQRSRYPDVDFPFAIAQIAGRQRIREKLPSLYSDPRWELPVTLSLEQCSSEQTAQYKASLLSQLADCSSLVDLTGGFGIDFWFCSRGFEQAHYVEQNEELCRIARHNFGTDPKVQIHHTDALAYLEHMESVSVIVVDPARRDHAGRKVAALGDCTPDLTQIHRLLVDKAERVLVKLSPMLDIHEALRQLPETEEVHIVSIQNECKEVLLLLCREPRPIVVCCVDLGTNQRFSYPLQPNMCSDAVASVQLPPIQSGVVENPFYLYEPNASVMKAGCFHELEHALNIRQLTENSHLYLSDKVCDAFPGRAFVVHEVRTLGKEDCKALSALGKANISARNFPLRPEELRKKLKLRDGGDTYLFATTDAENRHLVFVCRKSH